MQQTSAIWKQLWAAGAPLEARAVIAGTVYNDISAPVIVRAAMQERLGIGNVAAASLSLVIRGAGSIPRSAAVVIETRLNDGATASEWLPQGTFYISRRARDPVTGLLALECYDALLKAQGQAVLEDVFWTTKSGDFITTAGGDRICFYTAPTGDMRSLARFLAALLGLSLDPRSVIRTGPPYEITSPDEGATIRDILSIIAQANGGNWIVTPQNQLRLVPVVDVTGASEATQDAVDVAGVTGGINQSDSAVITGIRGALDKDAWLIGDDTGVVLDVSITPVIAAEMAEDMLGRRVQAYSLDGAVCDPAAELGDFVRAGVHGEIASVLYTQRITLGPACRSGMGSPDGGEITDEYPYISKNGSAISLLKATVKEISESAIVSVDVEYAQNQSTTVAPTSGWSTDAPQWRDGYYIWQRTKTTTASETSYSQPTCISGRDGVDGQTGPQGPQGQTGIGVSAVVEQYYLSTSSTEPTGGSWSTDQPQWVSGKYIWTRSQVTWTDNTTTYTAPVLAKAINGANSTANDASEAVTTLDNSLTQQNIFNRLTDNGAAQGIILYNGQLYINATYINAGLLSVGRIGFNDVEGHYQVPNENDPTSLLPGEAISDGWIIGTDSYQDITLFNCDYAVPLRGQTITLTFTYKTRVANGISLYRAFESSDGAYVSYEDYWFPQTDPPYVPPNPYTYRFTVPNDAENLVFYVYGCDGVKNISVSVSGTPITPPTIKFDYAGLRIGNLLINRDGNVILDGYIHIDKPVYLSKVTLVEALSMSNGGTGGSTPAAARENIGSGCASGSFETADGYTVTVEDGFITRIS